MYPQYRRLITKTIFFFIASFLFSSCSYYSRIDNRPLKSIEMDTEYRQLDFARQHDFGEVMLILSFSGGGTRAAALSYGVLKELRDTHIKVDGRQKKLLDEIDIISSVSGGSFTAAYYGLFGKKIFDDYEDVFLKQNVQKILINGLLNPINWYYFLTTGFDRSALAIEYYDKYIFQKATFADLAGENKPFIQINATDLGTGQHFRFTQNMFDYLCSDLSDFKVARAVAASSAVPVAFAPIAVENFSGCEKVLQKRIKTIEEEQVEDMRVQQVTKDYSTYLDKNQRNYIHLVDGGISDNLGIRSVYDHIEMSGGAWIATKKLTIKIPKYLVIILVNAQTSPTKKIELSDEEPDITEVVDAVSDAQIHRYNLETISLVRENLSKWAQELSTGNKTVHPYFIEISFEDISSIQERRFYNNIATSLALPPKQVNKLVEEGQRLLKKSKEFQQLVQELK